MTEFLKTSDLMAVLVAAGWSNVYNISNPMTMGLRSGVISIIARLLSSSEFSKKMTSLNSNQKNQFVVAILNAMEAYRSKSSVMKGAFTGVAIDLIGQEVLNTFNFDDQSLISFSGTTNTTQG